MTPELRRWYKVEVERANREHMLLDPMFVLHLISLYEDALAETGKAELAPAAFERALDALRFALRGRVEHLAWIGDDHPQTTTWARYVEEDRALLAWFERSAPLPPVSELPANFAEQFLETRAIAGQGLCGVMRFASTCGLCAQLAFDRDFYFYSARYCYASSREALAALREWDGLGDPPGPWIKEKKSERYGPGAR